MPHFGGNPGGDVQSDNNTVVTSSTVTSVQSVTPVIVSNVDGLTPESAIQKYWRPAMAYAYLFICLMDFVGFPLLSMLIPVIYHGFGIVMVYVPWLPLTLTNGGMIHLSFGSVIGVTAWTRGQEKIKQMEQ